MFQILVSFSVICVAYLFPLFGMFFYVPLLMFLKKTFNFESSTLTESCKNSRIPGTLHSTYSNVNILHSWKNQEIDLGILLLTRQYILLSFIPFFKACICVCLYTVLYSFIFCRDSCNHHQSQVIGVNTEFFLMNRYFDKQKTQQFFPLWLCFS